MFCVWVASILAFLCSLAELCECQTLYPLWEKNGQFFPESGASANTAKCDIPPFQEEDSTFSPTDDSCPVHDNSTLFTSDLQSIAQAYAPVLFFHPLEENTMSAVNRTLDDPEAGRLVIEWDDYGIEIFSETLTPESMLDTTRDPDYSMFSHKFHFQHDIDEEYKAGDGFDEQGRSRAPIYWNMFSSSHDTMTFNYFFYFTWSAAAGAGVLSSLNGTTQYTRIQHPPYGVQEGDWESLSVTVCKGSTTLTPLAITYRQNSWGQVQDCRKGDCLFYKDTKHPVGFVSLGTHEVYPNSVEELIYADVKPLEYFVNLQQVLLVHRTAYADKLGQYRLFEPNFNNVRHLPEQSEIPETVDRSDYWVAYSGVWGRITELDPNTTGTFPNCLGNDTLSYQGCPTEEENPIFNLYLQMTQVIEPKRALVKAATGILEFLSKFFLVEYYAPYGPATARYYQEHVLFDQNSQIYRVINPNETGKEYCGRIVDQIPDTSREAIDFEYLPFVKNVIGVVLLFVFLTICNMILLFSWRRRKVKPTFEADKEGRFLRPDRYQRNELFLTFWFLLAAYVLTLAGAVIFFVGYLRITYIFRSKETFVNWGAMDTFLIVAGSVVLATDTLMIFASWAMTEKVWLKINRQFQRMVGNEDSVPRVWHWLDGFPFLSRKTYQITFSFVVTSLVLSLFMVTFGLYHVGFSYMFGTVCRLYIGSLDGVCIKFPGWDEIQCGKDFQEFCRDWERVALLVTMWGGFVTVGGHFYMVFFSGVMELYLGGHERTLSFYPSTKDEYNRYLERIGLLDQAKNAETNECTPKEDPFASIRGNMAENAAESVGIVDVDEPETREIT